MPPPPPARRLLHVHVFLSFLSLLVFLAARWRPAAASALSTFALAKAGNTTIVCGLLPSASSPLLVDLNCTAAGGDHTRQETYPSSHPFAALAGGEDFLCAVGPSGERAGDVDMRWWDLSGNGDGREKRVYSGAPLRALAAGEYKVCGVLAGGELHCWRWRGLDIPRELRFVAAAVGDGFVCGILNGTAASIRCFGNDTADPAVTHAPSGGNYDVVAACGTRACALSTAGALQCWGRGAPDLPGAGASAGYAALALGEGGVCGLRTNGTIRCFGEGVAAPPGTLAGAQYLDVKAQGKAFCGLLMADYSLVCWGGREFNATNHLVFPRVMPGPCAPMSSCRCGVLPGSANFCAARSCICHDCVFDLNVARPNASTAFNSELTALARANHKNIVCLLGCCADSGERVLVYEFMANGTLHDQLHSRVPMAPAVSSWRGRLAIALDAARGIEYMHVYAVPPIIHRDVKSANILLDDAWTAKIADFGLSSVLDPTAGACDDAGGGGEPLYTGGTVGYMDPEYYRLQHLTDKSDVYSFGVVLLELMSGCRVVQRYAESVTPKNVVQFAVPHILADEVARVLDPRLPAPTPEEAEALAYVGYLAADCVGSVGCDRPSMTEVVDALERALAACGAAPLSRAGTGRRPALSRSGTDQFDLTDTD
ncbi:serine/threonine-protein kinase-like protein CCR4 [Setaria italica]|uniref:serine/threonine-protein kinase-like protein CCR4 n=1 Tax=Setaria italica TaxID=4555 RepID=UPI000BE52220|nr:serine/threonine-protein kinase-like protein CCR4 [Setaria italica]